MLKKINFSEFWRTSFGRYWITLKQAKGYLHLLEKDYVAALECFTESTRIPENISLYSKPTLPQQARRMFYLGLCQAKLGYNSAAKKCWEAVLELKIAVRFEPSVHFSMACARLFHVFALKALKRHAEAEMCMQLIKAGAFYPRFPDSIMARSVED